MKAQILIALDDDGKLSVGASSQNPFLCLGLLEMAKDVIKGQAAQQREARVQIPKIVVPPIT